MGRFTLFPPQASTMASRVDDLFFFLCAITIFFVVAIAMAIIVFMVRFRRRPDSPVPHVGHGSNLLEVVWSVPPLILVLIVFFWGATLYASLRRPPDDAIPIAVVGKQWMWKAQHLEGRREINELHVPVGRPVRVTLTSEDVIHGFYVPAFRVKQDAVPGRYTELWFEATRPGRYQLFCSAYCGTIHSGMIGWVVAMEPGDFQAWLAGRDAGGPAVPMASAGEAVFKAQGCPSCHQADDGGRGPKLAGLYGTTVKLQGGATALADDAYLRQSILSPQARIVAGYEPIMPTYQGLLSEEDVLQVLAYIKSLGAPGAVATGEGK